MAKNSEFVSKFNEIMGKYGSIAEFSKVLYEANVIPSNPIVIGECMIPVNDLERCYGGSLKSCLESRFSEREFIDKLGITKLTKKEIIELLTDGVSNASREMLKFEQTSETLKNEQNMNGVSNPSQEMLKFEQTSETLKNEQNMNGVSNPSQEMLKFEQNTDDVSNASRKMLKFEQTSETLKNEQSMNGVSNASQ